MFSHCCEMTDIGQGRSTLKSANVIKHTFTKATANRVVECKINCTEVNMKNKQLVFQFKCPLNFLGQGA